MKVSYKLLDTYFSLDKKGKFLIDEIIRFCKQESRFPKEKELIMKNGYTARTQYYRYFDSKNIDPIYDYIVPVYDLSEVVDADVFKNLHTNNGNGKAIYIVPKQIRCVKCSVVKDFNENNFIPNGNNKFGLRYICRECQNQYSLRLYYKSIGIVCDNIEDISPITWWEYMYSGKVFNMPSFCYQEPNLIIVVRHVINNVLNLNTKEEICNSPKLIYTHMKQYKIGCLCQALGGKLKMLQKCFPEMDVSHKDVFPETYPEKRINAIIQEWMKKNNMDVLDVLKKGITLKFNKRMFALVANKFNYQKADMFLWYFNSNNILHPVKNIPITIYDFEELPKRFWNDKNNIIDRVKLYCEYECDESIINYLSDTEGLKAWIRKYFTSKKLGEIILYAKGSVYNYLVLAYPEIKSNNVLFEWEWHQYSKNDNKSLVKMLREFVLYRLKDIVKNVEIDLPIHLNKNCMSYIMPKFNKQLDKNRFSSYYEWACLSFPEHASKWAIDQFENYVAFDGTVLLSYQEVSVYNYVKMNLGINLIYLSKKRYKGFSFNYKGNVFHPDFIIETSDKPIVIEYYGMYSETNPYKVIVEYTKKTKIKNLYYKSRNDIYFVDLYPDDLKNNFEGLKVKLEDILANSNIKL